MKSNSTIQKYKVLLIAYYKTTDVIEYLKSFHKTIQGFSLCIFLFIILFDISIYSWADWSSKEENGVNIIFQSHGIKFFFFHFLHLY
jgi:hypothetical protein